MAQAQTTDAEDLTQRGAEKVQNFSTHLIPRLGLFHMACFTSFLRAAGQLDRRVFMLGSLVRVSQQQRWKNQKKLVFLSHCLGAWDWWSGRGDTEDTSARRTHETTET